jgi:hypothetical protein
VGAPSGDPRRSTVVTRWKAGAVGRLPFGGGSGGGEGGGEGGGKGEGWENPKTQRESERGEGRENPKTQRER